MKLYFVRHGKTDWNIKRLIQGSTDLELSNEGIKDINIIKKDIDKIDFDICFVSPLKRAIETANILVGNKCDIVINNKLIERTMGKLEGTSVKNYDISKYWNINYEKDDLGVETPKELLNRTKEFIEELKKYNYDKVLVVSHAGVMKALHYNIIGYDDDTDLTEFFSEHNIIYSYEI